MAKQRKGTNVVDLIEHPAPEHFAVSREAWAATPAVIREEILRMISELARGHDKYCDAAARDAEMADFHEMAKASGKNLADVIREFVAIENFVRAEPIRGIEHLAARYDFDLGAWAMQKLEAGEVA